MKSFLRFLTNIIIVIVLASIVLVGLTWYNVSSLKRADWKLPEETHIIVVGPSSTGNALNEEHIKGFQNMSRDGTHPSYTIPLLPRIFEDNPQIDTVWINHGRFMFRHYMDTNGTPGLQAIRDKLPLMFYDVEATNWSGFLLNLNFYGAILNPDCIQTMFETPRKLKDYRFGYTSVDAHNLMSDNVTWSIVYYDSLKAEYGTNVFPKEWILEHCKTEDYWSRKAIEICKQHNVVPVLFFTPLYQFDRWCTWEGFCDYIKDYDENILIADYEDFVFPDDSVYRKDVHHLNKDGADYFTAHIAKHGLRAIPLKQWLKEKGY